MGQRLLTRREIASALGFSHQSFGQFVSKHRHNLPESTQRGPTYLYRREEAEKMIKYTLRYKFMTPIPKDFEVAKLFYAIAVEKTEEATRAAMKGLAKINGWDRIREA